LVTGIGRINTPAAWSYLIGIGVDELIADDQLFETEAKRR
jgi:hypothetical protein